MRFECEIHRDYVASIGCLVCHAPATIHHLMHIPVWIFTFIGRRDDRKSIPLCPGHHQKNKDSVHQMGSEAEFFIHHFGHELYGFFMIVSYWLTTPSEKVKASLPDMVMA